MVGKLIKVLDSSRVEFLNTLSIELLDFAAIPQEPGSRTRGACNLMGLGLRIARNCGVDAPAWVVAGVRLPGNRSQFCEALFGTFDDLIIVGALCSTDRILASTGVGLFDTAKFSDVAIDKLPVFPEGKVLLLGFKRLDDGRKSLGEAVNGGRGSDSGGGIHCGIVFWFLESQMRVTSGKIGFLRWNSN